jgi:hypothetical protein
MNRFKSKLIGGVVAFAAVILSLGAGTALAWTYSLSGTGTCQENGSFKITWTVNNGGENKDFHVTASNRAVVPVGTSVAKFSNQSFSEFVPGTTLATYTLQLSGNWPGPGGDSTIQTKSTSVTLSHACQQPRHECNENYIRNDHDECVPMPQKDCDGDYDNSPESECAGGKGGGPQDVTLCHATDSSTNPYEKITINVDGAYHAHYTQHQGPVFSATVTGKWGDIIPAFTFNQQTYSLNWDSAGQAIYNNGCVPVQGGQGGGPTTTTTTSTPQVLAASTTTQVAVVPTGSVNGGEGAASRVTNSSSMVGMVGALLSVGSGLAMLNRRQK